MTLSPSHSAAQAPTSATSTGAVPSSEPPALQVADAFAIHAQVAIPTTAGDTDDSPSTVHWVALATTGQCLTGTTEGSDLRGACMAAFEAALSVFDLQHGASVYCGVEDFADALLMTREAFPSLTVQPYRGESSGTLVRTALRRATDAVDRQTQAARSAIEQATPKCTKPHFRLAENASRVPMSRRPTSERRVVIATDGSYGGTGGPRGSWAWISEDGVAVSGKGGTNILAAELLAIHSVLANIVVDQPVLIRSDSQAAIHAIQAEVGISTARQIRHLLRTRDAKLQWVRGHAGDPMNEAADRLAVQTRRHFQGCGGEDVLREHAHQIIDEMTEQLTALKAGKTAAASAVPQLRSA